MWRDDEAPGAPRQGCCSLGRRGSVMLAAGCGMPTHAAAAWDAVHGTAVVCLCAPSCRPPRRGHGLHGRQARARRVQRGVALHTPHQHYNPILVLQGKTAPSAAFDEIKAAEESARNKRIGVWRYGDPGSDSEDEQPWGARRPRGGAPAARTR